MWVKERISSYRFSKIGNYKNTLEKTVDILQNKFGDNKVFLSEEKDQTGKTHYFVKANLKQQEIENFNRIYDELTNMFFASKNNEHVQF